MTDQSIKIKILPFWAFVILLLTGNKTTEAQVMIGPELLDKSIAFHDPQNLWGNQKLGFSLLETRPNGPDRKSFVLMNDLKGYFELKQKRNNHEIVYAIQNEEVDVLFDGSGNFSETLRDSFNLTSERGHLLKNYYSYLWGLPMKLKDPGTYVLEKIEETTFLNKAVFALKVTYAPKVGKDIWYFYFDKNDYHLAGYRFYHDEEKNDGEYITLSGIETVNGIKLPKERKWYTHKEGKYLGADILMH
jgi:hypothetical protein